MRHQQSYPINELAPAKQQLLRWASQFDVAVYLDSNQYTADTYSRYECVVAVQYPLAGNTHPTRAISTLAQLHNTAHSDWLFGIVSYDLKNELEPLHLSSAHPDGVGMPLLYFFVPDVVLAIERNDLHTLHIMLLPHLPSTAEQLWQQISQVAPCTIPQAPLRLQARLDKAQYLHRVQELQQHIQRGDVYEANFCQEFFSVGQPISPQRTFERLNQQTQAPFAAFVRLQQHYLLCASPERFVQQQGQHIISQPIKGTAKRHPNNPLADQVLAQQLRDNLKEQTENVMIVDLVRNDLSRMALRNSVTVSELFGVYSFKTVHHLISTVQAQLPPHTSVAQILTAMFPMGSMTGAPKIRAMQLIEQLEVTQRGLYSGTVGYVDPQGNADFNVVIRSLLYNQQTHYLSLQTGSAITHQACAELEYDECLLKAHVIRQLLLQQDY